jgi:acetyl esterase/lipase
VAKAPLHPVLRELAEAEARADTGHGRPTLAERRAGYLRTAEHLGGDPEPVDGLRDADLDGGLAARVYTPRAAAGTLVWFHGGGWAMGDLDGFDRAARALSNATRAVVASIDYRLSPEHPFPAAVQDADRALAWAAAELPGPVAVGGDSAGGNLAAVAARHARDARATSATAPVLQVLVYPVCDATMSTASYAEFAAGPLLSVDDMRELMAMYLAGADPAHPDVSVLAATDLTGVAPAFVAVAGHDVLRDEGLAYAAALRAAGVPAEVRCYADMAHGFLRYGGVVDRARELMADIGAAVRVFMKQDGPP